MGYQHLAYEVREDVPSYEAESLFGKENRIIREHDKKRLPKTDTNKAFTKAKQNKAY